MKNLILILSIVFLSATACKQTPKKDQGPTQMEKVMAVHDSLMPKMNTLTKLVAELNEKADTTETGMKYEAAKKDLQAAHKSMMDWMQDFGTKFDHEEILKRKELTPEKKELLNEEEKEVEGLKEQIDTSIKNAEVLLGEN
ncbi:hypothetical protein [Galbibacter pacificus]|uniref:Viral A-type inclusion protein n=1 Tax=Galbibacter pacificus TaxID=2996052 RepID=A0ABT6FT47_9FLAO|nr:hypothetical protein [Galbibacter pacificus]MDG3582599.1 hypothetical protein [Galbibacter pacificus]MDG3586282.1 hypothetical protein [Galbibacter pacificus]